MLASLGYESEYSTPVRLKFDDDRPLRQTWGISDSHDTLFPFGREKQFLTQLMQHNKLRRAEYAQEWPCQTRVRCLTSTMPVGKSG
jgi:hypothetical protein